MFNSTYNITINQHVGTRTHTLTCTAEFTTAEMTTVALLEPYGATSGAQASLTTLPTEYCGSSTHRFVFPETSSSGKPIAILPSDPNFLSGATGFASRSIVGASSIPGENKSFWIGYNLTSEDGETITGAITSAEVNAVKQNMPSFDCLTKDSTAFYYKIGSSGVAESTASVPCKITWTDDADIKFDFYYKYEDCTLSLYTVKGSVDQSGAFNCNLSTATAYSQNTYAYGTSPGSLPSKSTIQTTIGSDYTIVEKTLTGNSKGIWFTASGGNKTWVSSLPATITNDLVYYCGYIDPLATYTVKFYTIRGRYDGEFIPYKNTAALISSSTVTSGTEVTCLDPTSSNVVAKIPEGYEPLDQSTSSIPNIYWYTTNSNDYIYWCTSGKLTVTSNVDVYLPCIVTDEEKLIKYGTLLSMFSTYKTKSDAALQTKLDAIDLSDSIDLTDIENAITVANVAAGEAQSTATEAKTLAQSAQTAANTASTTATAAQTAADTAQTTATAAQTTADEAKTLAQTAQSTASAAQTAAEAAQEAASNATVDFATEANALAALGTIL